MSGSLYVYAVVEPSTADACSGEPGIDGAPIQAVVHGKLAALASPVGSDRIRPTRANLQAHERAVSQAHRAGGAVPLRFGTIMPADSVIPQLLEPDGANLASLLQDLTGKDAYRLKATYLPDVALREAVANNRDIRRLKDRAASPAQQMGLGELVVGELQRIREVDADRIIGSLLSCLASYERLPDRSDEVAVHAALLVERRRTKNLEKAIEKQARRESERMTFELIGPLAPWDFTVIEVGAA